MPKFSDSSFNILNTYFEEANYKTDSSTNGGSLIGGNTGIVASGGYWFVFYIIYENEYKKVRFHMDKDDYVSGNSFIFTKHPDDPDFESGSNVYFKIGDAFYTWLIKNTTLYKDYINTNVPFLYFGKIYPNNGEGYIINFYGMKDYVLEALPEHNRTQNLSELFKLYFDNIYQKIYNLSKNVKTLLDPSEVDIDYLNYIADMYNVTIRNSLNEVKKREFVKNIIYLLKRIGTYSSVYIVWKLISRDPYNNINIYERWHDKEYPSAPVLPNFKDHLYTSFYDPVIYRKGCAGDRFYYIGDNITKTKPGFYFHNEKTIKYDVWDVDNVFNDKEILVQCFNFRKTLVPENITLTNDKVYIEYNGNEECSVILANSDYTHTQFISGSTWIINHNLDNKEVILNVYNSEDKFIFSYEAELINENTCNVCFGDANISGYVNILKPDYVYEKTEGAIYWNINHNLGYDISFVQCYDLNYKKIRPLSIVSTDNDNIRISFDSITSGYAFICAAAKNLYYPKMTDDGYISPHYRVEVDLNCSPLGNNYVIDKETINGLYEYWEMIRPVSKVSHYNLLLAPKTNFNKNFISNYNYTSIENRGKIETKCCRNVFSFSNDVDVYAQRTKSDRWVFVHRLNTKEVEVQCYDWEKNQILPKDIYLQADDIVTATFSSGQNGYMVVKKVDYNHEQVISALTWDINHSLDHRENISQAYDQDDYREIPLEINLTDDDNETMTFSESLSGSGKMLKADYIYTGNNSNTWNIYHELQSELVFVQCYDLSYNMILPDNIYLNSENHCIITFPSNTSGYALINKVGDASTQIDLMSSVISGGYMKIGTGKTGRYFNTDRYNDLENPIYTITDLEVDFDENNYYIEGRTVGYKAEEDITEFGVFNNEDNLIWYTYCDTVYKIEDFDIILYYRIAR